MSTVLFDFSVPTAADAWSAIDDRVMGGVSRMRLLGDGLRLGCALYPLEPAVAECSLVAVMRSTRLFAGREHRLARIRMNGRFEPVTTDCSKQQP